MEIPETVWIVGGAVIVVVGVMCALLVLRSRRVNLTRPASPDQKPVWMRTMPPPETISATQMDDEGIALYGYDPGEKLAAPFAEQIEDIVRARLSADPALAVMDVDLGTASDGGLEIWVDGERYTDVNLLPDERLRRVFRQAIESWEQAQEG